MNGAATNSASVNGAAGKNGAAANTPGVFETATTAAAGDADFEAFYRYGFKIAASGIRRRFDDAVDGRRDSVASSALKPASSTEAVLRRRTETVKNVPSLIVADKIDRRSADSTKAAPLDDEVDSVVRRGVDSSKAATFGVGSGVAQRRRRVHAASKTTTLSVVRRIQSGASSPRGAVSSSSYRAVPSGVVDVANGAASRRGGRRVSPRAAPSQRDANVNAAPCRAGVADASFSVGAAPSPFPCHRGAYGVESRGSVLTDWKLGEAPATNAASLFSTYGDYHGATSNASGVDRFCCSPDVNRRDSNDLAPQLPSEAVVSKFREQNGNGVVLTRIVFVAATIAKAHGEINEFNRQTQSQIRNKAHRLQKAYEPITGICFLFPQAALFVIESTEMIVASFFDAVKTLTTTPLSQAKSLRSVGAAASEVALMSEADSVLANLQVISISSNIRGRCHPTWLSKSYNVSKSNVASAVKDKDFAQDCVKIVASLAKLGAYLTAETKRAAGAKTPAERRRILSDALELKIVFSILPSYDLFAALTDSDPDLERCRLMEKLLSWESKTKDIEDDVGEQNFPFNWVKKRFEGVPCCLQGMKGFPEVVPTSLNEQE